jgi:Rha family phage regulatory protein
METLFSDVPVDASRQPVVKIDDGEAMADSRDVAAFFGKRHTEVLRAIRDLNCSADFSQRNFASFKNNDLTGESTSHVLMTKDGFTFLAMGFTGGRAGAFKERYIAAFNAMEAELRRRPAVDAETLLRDPAAMRGLLLGYTEKVLALEATVSAQKPMVDTLHRIAGSDDLFGVRVTAKMVDMPERKFIDWLMRNRWAYRQNGTRHLLCFADKHQAGLCRNVAAPYDKPDGTTGVRDTLKFTTRGVVKVASALNVELDEAAIMTYGAVDIAPSGGSYEARPSA